MPEADYAIVVAAFLLGRQQAGDGASEVARRFEGL